MHAELAAAGFHGLRFKHDCVFRFIDDEGSRLTDLADRSGLSKQGVAEAVDELAALGYVERSDAPHDRRTKIIRLTERGRAGQQAATRILTDIEHSWAQSIGSTDLSEFRRTMEGIIDASRAK